MSVLSGFPTRNLESQYTQTVCLILKICQENLLSLLKNEPIDFIILSEQFPNLFNRLKELESHKSIDPKFSLYCEDLAKFFNCKVKVQLPKIEESKSSKNFDIFLMNDAFTYENPKIEPSYTPSNYSFNRSHSSQKAKYSTRKTNIYVSTKHRPVSSKSRGQVSSSSNQKNFMTKVRERVVPSKYYHDRALELISENIDKSYD